MRFGIDLGGTKIELAAFGPGNVELFCQRVPTPHDYAATLQAIKTLVETAEAKLGARGTVGIGIPGAISPATGLVKNANNTRLIGKPFDRDLAQTLARPVRVANDANCFALSEAADGAGTGYDLVFGVIIGTGVGGGIVVRGHVVTGPHAIAGEWGHNSLPWPKAEWHELPGPHCYCGKYGCIETYLSGPGLSNDYARAKGGERDPHAIVAAADAGEATAKQTMERYYDRFARALSGVINILDPDAAVLGGGLSKIAALYTELPKRLGAYVYSDVCKTPILKNKHGDASGVRGAAWLWNENESA
jgi:fructokinase